MKRKLGIVLAIICTLAIGLCACGKNTGGLFDVGDFTLEVPAGWMVWEQPDYFGEMDGEGNYPPRTDAIALIKGGRSEYDIYSKPTLYIYYYSDMDAQAKAEETKAWSYGEMADKDPVTINGKECIVFEEKQEAFVDEEKYYLFNYVFYPITDTSCIQFTVPIDMIDFAGVSLEDADVREMMESVQLK